MTTSKNMTTPGWMDLATKQRLRSAAARATQLHPGPVGELLNQELLSWMVFGHHLGSTLIMQVTDELPTAEPRRR